MLGNLLVAVRVNTVRSRKPHWRTLVGTRTLLIYKLYSVWKLFYTRLLQAEYINLLTTFVDIIMRFISALSKFVTWFEIASSTF